MHALCMHIMTFLCISVIIKELLAQDDEHARCIVKYTRSQLTDLFVNGPLSSSGYHRIIYTHPIASPQFSYEYFGC